MSLRRKFTVCGLALALGLCYPQLALADPQSDLEEAQRRMEQIGGELMVVQDELADLTAQLEQTDNEMERTQSSINETEQRLAEERSALAQHMRVSYMRGGFKPIDFILGSGNLDDFLSRMHYLEKVNEHETAQIAQVNELQDELTAQLADLEGQRDLQMGRVDEASAKVGEYEQLAAEAQQYYDQLDAEVKAQLAAEAERQAQEEAERAASLAAAMSAAEEEQAPAPQAEQPAADSQEAQAPEENQTPEEPEVHEEEPEPSYDDGGSSDGCYPGGGVASAYSCIGWPYVWGGYSPSDGGFDCSGLVSYCYGDGSWRRGCEPLAYAIMDAGLWKSSMSDLNYGDLIFTDSGLNHVGIYIGNGQLIHSPTFGRTVCVQDVWECYGGGPFVMPD